MTCALNESQYRFASMMLHDKQRVGVRFSIADLLRKTAFLMSPLRDKTARTCALLNPMFGKIAVLSVTLVFRHRTYSLCPSLISINARIARGRSHRLGGACAAPLTERKHIKSQG